MRKLCLTALAVFMACAVWGLADPDVVPILSVTCQTNATATITNTPAGNTFYWGWIDTVILDVSTAYTGTVEVVTAGGTGTGPSRQIFKKTTVYADGSYPVRDIVTTQAGADISNVPAPIPVVQDRIRVYAYGFNAGTNAATVNVYLVFRHSP